MSVADMTMIQYNVGNVNDCHERDVERMSRWEPNAGGRLEQAALALYEEHGFEQTTVTEIAERAGLTERTFFRYFVDKREVLFGGQDALLATYVRAIETAPADSTPLAAVIAALEASVPIFQDRHNTARRRQAVIAANPELQERELLKGASIASAMAEALRKRGATDSVARLAAQIGITVFSLAFIRWVDEPEEQELSRLIQEAFDQLRSIVAGT
jgi:AcrR family transcriptional regulator